MTMGGAEFGTELGELWLCAQSHLPSIADRAVRANGHLAGTSADSSVFERRGVTEVAPGYSVTGTTNGRVFPHWDRLRDALQNALAQSVTNIYDRPTVTEPS